MKMFAVLLKVARTTLALLLTFASAGSVAFGQDSPKPVEEEASGGASRITYGTESDFSSGYAWRGLVISDRPVASPSVWISAAGFTFIASNILSLGDTSEGTRPRVTDLTLTYEREWKKLKIEPSLEMYWYRDPLNIAASKSMEASFKFSYPVGPIRLFTAHSFDVWTQRGAYFGEGGIEYNRRFSKKSKLESSLHAGWASSTFNDAYAGVSKPAFNVVALECSLTHYLTKYFYLSPHFEFSTIVDHDLHASLSRPNFFTFGLAIGVEF